MKKESYQYFKTYFYDLYLGSMVEILTEKCGCDVKLIDLKNDLHDMDVQYLMKIRINSESLLYLANYFDNKLALNYSGFYEQNVIKQYAFINNLSSDYFKDKLNHEISNNYDLLNDQNEFVEYISHEQNNLNKLVDEEYDKVLIQLENTKITKPRFKDSNEVDFNDIGLYVMKEFNPFKEFLQKYPYYTPFKVPKKLNPEIANQLYLNYPYKTDKTIRKIKYEYAKFYDISSSKEIDSQLETDLELVGHNPYMTNLYGFTFGIPDDAPNIYKIFPQDMRIDMAADIINEELNIDYLKSIGLVVHFEGLHNAIDKGILKRSICILSSWTLIFTKLSRRDLLMIKHYWGTEVASYFLFLSYLTKYIQNLAMYGLITEIVMRILYGLYPNFWIITLNGIYSIITILNSLNFINDYKQKEKLQKVLWGSNMSNDDINNDSNPTRNNLYYSNYQYDIVNQCYKLKHDVFDWWSVASWTTMAILLTFMTYLVGYFLDLKNQNFDDPTMSTVYGLMVTISIKSVYVLWTVLILISSNKENHELKSDKYKSSAVKNYVFQYFNLFYTFYYILYLHKYYYGLPCYEITVIDFANEEVKYESCMFMLTDQLYINVIFYFVFNIVEIGVPFVIQAFKKEDSNIDKYSALNDLIKDPIDDLTDDYVEVVIQIVMLWTFGQSFPASAFLLWLSLLFEIRQDLYKLIKFHRRGACNSTKGIGIWMNIMHVCAQFAIISSTLTLVLEIYEYEVEHALLRGYTLTLNDILYIPITWIILQMFFLTYNYILKINKKTSLYDYTEQVFRLFHKITRDTNFKLNNSLANINDSEQYLSKNDLQIKKGEYKMSYSEFEN